MDKYPGWTANLANDLFTRTKGSGAEVIRKKGGAGFAVGKIGAAALGAAAEHPELLARSLLFVALAEGLAVLGFAVAMLIVMKPP